MPAAKKATRKKRTRRKKKAPKIVDATVEEPKAEASEVSAIVKSPVESDTTEEKQQTERENLDRFTLRQHHVKDPKAFATDSKLYRKVNRKIWDGAPSERCPVLGIAPAEEQCAHCPARSGKIRKMSGVSSGRSKAINSDIPDQVMMKKYVTCDIASTGMTFDMLKDKLTKYGHSAFVGKAKRGRI